MSKSLRLLQIEDSETDADLILRLLMQAGFKVFSLRVEDGEALRHALETSAWDIIIADYHLPGFDAPGALRILQECGSDIPCIVVSGMMGEETAVEMMKSGAHDYLTKNNLTRLVPAVERELAEAALRRETREAQEELRQSQERLALAVEATQLGTFDYYPQTGQLIWSKSAHQHYGVSSDAEVDFDTFVRALHPLDRARALGNVRNALRQENGGAYSHEYRIIGIEDGQERWISSRGRVFFDDHARAVRVIGVIQNVTERQRLEQQLLQSQKLQSVGRLAASIAHDFNNLLTVINGYAHLVLAGLGPEDQHRESMEELSQAAMQAAALIRQLLSFSRRQAAEPKTIVMNEFVKDFENMLRRLLGDGIQLTVSLDPQAGVIRADPALLGQVLMNLTVNAKDAMPSGGRLLIQTSNSAATPTSGSPDASTDPGEYAVLTVTDTGTGMSAEVQSHLFEPFYTTKEQGKGTGLGLSTVYGIVVNQSGGNISVVSQPGHGTTFTLSFPALRTERPAEPEARTRPSSVRGETILLAEDEPSVRKYTRRMLEREGYTVLEACDGEEALALAKSRTGTIHLLLTDIIMPTMGGMELAENFGAAYPGVPVLFMTAYTDQIMRHWNVLSAYIQKPYNLSDLLLQVRELLDRTSSTSLPAQDQPTAG